MGNVEAEEVEWLWKPYIPLGKITILQGDPGLGKTFLAIQLAAIVSLGEHVPFCKGGGKIKAGNVIFQTAEDGLADTIKVRLEDAWANCKRIFVIDESKKALTLDDERLKEAICRKRAKLVVIDPLQGYLGAGTNMHRANEIRPLMTRLNKIASEYGCAIVLIGHQTKAQGNNAIYRGLGSIDIAAAARSILVVCKVPEFEHRRALVHIKSSLEANGQTILFDLDPEQGFDWVGLSNLTIDDFSRNRQKEGVKQEVTLLNECMEFLQAALSEKPIPATEIKDSALAEGFTEVTINRAKKAMQVHSFKGKGSGGQWYWGLKDSQSKSDDKVDNLDNL